MTAFFKNTKIFAVGALVSLCGVVFALPGFTPSIPDSSGEYVYFCDTTFYRTSYVGFLAYDERTFAARYFAPKDDKAKLPAKSIEIYVTINPDAAHLEITGEKIGSGVGPDDTEIVNYLHDLMYELSARRIKAGNVEPLRIDGQNGFLRSGAVKKNEDFMQFGGRVTVYYDALIPLFNIKLIEDAAGKNAFYAVAAGRLLTSSDRSFSDFAGFPAKYADNRHVFKKSKGEKIECDLPDGRSVTLDKNWTQRMENLWACKDAAILSAGAFNQTADSAAAKTDGIPFGMVRQLLLSTDGMYINLSEAKIAYTVDSCAVELITFQPETGSVMKNFKTLSQKDGGLYLFAMSVFYNIYSKNKTYFDAVRKSYAVKD
ncbi:MAG: hypothetical protein ACTTKL_10805 [Treponema sp.]